MNLVAVLIVRDEAANLSGCLAALGGVVDGVHVHDTGSVDATVALARSLGATVSEGEWHDDFAAARNAAVGAAGRPDWVLSVDADERAVAAPERLRDLLRAAPAGAFLVEIDNRHDELPYTHRTPRLFRPAAMHWEGRVHERLTPTADPTAEAPSAKPSAAEPAAKPMPQWPVVPRDALHLVHLGYADPETRRRKAARNAGLAEATLSEISDKSEIATALLDLGRSYVGAGRRQAAVDAFERLRELAPRTRQWILGTDALARLLLGAGHDEAVVVLARQLRDAGVDGEYCDWLEAQALAQLGHPDTAWRLLRGVRRVVDPAGRSYPQHHLAELKRLLGELVTAGRGA
ncbi:glycosyltransferase [Dactylosporangium sp. CA-092794]|uniref:glycosyltransferase n=1 Tax=Dactylosporangium sp. CA-092794 TaxID=3239929 RepID=UPI003D8F0A29